MRILLATLALGASAWQTATPFRTTQLEVGPGSGEVLIADVNRDGHVDIVTKHLLQNQIKVSFGDSAGAFPRSLATDLPYGPGAIALGDMSGDGIPDLAIASRRDGAEFVEIWPNDGTGRFQSGPALRLQPATAYYKPTVSVADVIEDGRPDLIVVNGRSDRVMVVEGSATRGLRHAGAIEFPARFDRHYVELGDVNGDRHVDIVTTGSPEPVTPEGHLTIALGDGRGRFTWQPAMPAEAGPRIEALADVNGDSHVDAIVSHGAPRLSVLLGDGRGTFRHTAGSPFALKGETHAVVVDDLNGDRAVDLAAATADSVTVFLGRGGTFGPAQGSPFRAGPGAFALAVADLNRDGRKDLAASSFEGTALTLLFGR